MERPDILQCLHCGGEWRFVPPPPEAAPDDLGADAHDLLQATKPA
jgi:hypothetical protein